MDKLNRNLTWFLIFVALLGIGGVLNNNVEKVSALGQNALALLKGETVQIDCAGSQLTTTRLSAKSVLLKCKAGIIGPTNTPRPLVTLMPSIMPTATSDHGSMTIGNTWHTNGGHDGLNGHEHGDKAPEWADAFSLKNFGHPVIYGGDEATPNENVMKHQAFKGFLMKASGVDVYIRYHAASNPHDRAMPFHSYEVYSRDSSGNVSFWQGWIFFGYPEIRSQRMARHNEQGGVDPLNGINWPGRGQFIIAGSDKSDWNNYLRCEQWYGHAGLWSWDMSITICGATTFFNVDEHKTAFENMNTWSLTGSLGNSRRLEVSHYGPSNPIAGGENLPFDSWFCVKKQPNENRTKGDTPTWSISGKVSGPTACEAGWLPQYVASTYPKAGVYFQTGNTAEKTFSTSGVTIPN